MPCGQKLIFCILFALALATNLQAQQVIKVGGDGTIFEPNPDVIKFKTALQFEGATGDDYQTSISATDPTADRTITLPDASGVVTLSSAVPGAAGAVSMTASSIVFEGATADAFETTLTAVDPTADQTVSIANAGVNNSLLFSTLTTNTVDAANSIWGISNGLILEGATADAFELTIAPADVTADRTATFPDASGTIALSQSSSAVSLTADDQAVTPGTSTRIQLSSDNGTATNRTFTLSATGATTGAIYVLIGPETNQCELADTGIQKLSATWSPQTSDTLTLLFDGTNFIEICRADN